MAFDNVSAIKGWMSDALCRLSTGGGFSTRELYTDSDEVIFDVTRPIVINGIELFVYYHDLVDRSIIINLPQIDDKDRIPEDEFWKKFKKAHPQLLGALCDAVSEALRNLKNTKLDRYPRMADFAKWVVAAEPALPWNKGKFLEYYENNRNEAVQKSLSADPVSDAVIEMMKSRKKWAGTATELLDELEGSGYVTEKIAKSQMWPKSANVLSIQLRKAATFLRKVGIKVNFPRKADKRKIVIRKVTKCCK
jgi:hypothetical protein